MDDSPLAELGAPTQAGTKSQNYYCRGAESCIEFARAGDATSNTHPFVRSRISSDGRESSRRTVATPGLV